MIIISKLFINLLIAQLFSFDHEHSKFTVVLSQYRTTNSLINYSILKNNIQNGKDLLGDYIIDLEKVNVIDYEKWSKDEKMAFLINAYNALTIQLIINNYPLKSITNIGGIFWFINKRPWRKEFFSLLGGKIKTLDSIENNFLRGSLFNDYRIHAALNCASISCPSIRHEAYIASKLNLQLDDQMIQWLQDNNKNRIDIPGKKIFISQIFKWYKEDFSTNGLSIPIIFKKYGLVFDASFDVKYLDYDWKLNDSNLQSNL